ncbi:MAG TPA: response regulator [Gemmatimonadales bacterium]|nr:response regulator [Gemmatimonadales bacterium]
MVDDDPAIRRVLRRIFERHGCVVAEAASAAEALTQATTDPVPDAVVCDVLMPEVSGLEFYDQLVEQSPALAGRVVFLTGANRDPAVHLPIERRGVPLLGKLDDLELVVDAVRLALYNIPRP